jgi:hypothetical protein
MICTQIDSYVKTLIRNLEMLWVATLDDGTKVYSDYDRPTVSDHPYNRLKKYCEDNNKFIIKIEALMFGAPHTVMFENSDGLDGVFILRGSSRDIKIETGEQGPSYKQLIVGVLRDNEDIIDVKKFCWPENSIEPFNQTRLITPENAKLMIFKNGSRKKTRESIQVALDRRDV